MSKKKTTEQFKEELAIKNPNIEVLGEYINKRTKILVKDKRCEHIWKAPPDHLLKGTGCPNRECVNKKISSKNLSKDKTGEINYNSYGRKMTIILFKNNKDIDILFDNNIIVKNKYYRDFLKGEIVNPYDKSVCGVGYLGEGIYNTTINKRHEKSYEVWRNMLDRCYNENRQEIQPTYKGCSVYIEWHNFQTFAKWYDENYYQVDNEVMEIDKDILNKGNKEYNPNNCILVPNVINCLFVNCKSVRGEYPIGVTLTNNPLNKYRARCRNVLTNKRIHIGVYATIEQAFNAYKKYKENHIKEVADYYKEQIPIELYEAMYRYKVEITD